MAGAASEPLSAGWLAAWLAAWLATKSDRRAPRNLVPMNLVAMSLVIDGNLLKIVDLRRYGEGRIPAS